MDKFVYDFDKEEDSEMTKSGYRLSDVEDKEYVMTLGAVEAFENKFKRPALKITFTIDDLNNMPFNYYLNISPNTRDKLINLFVSLGIPVEGKRHLVQELEDKIGTKVLAKVYTQQLKNGRTWKTIEYFKRFVEVIEAPAEDEIPF